MNVSVLPRGARGKVLVCLAGAALCASAAVEPTHSAPGPISHWRLDEGQGTTTSDTAASRTATLRNGATWTTGRHGAAVSLDGRNDYISLPQLNVSGSAITLAAWVRSSSFPSSTSPRFISKASSSNQVEYWTLGHTNNRARRLRFRLRTGNTTTTLTASTGALPLATWYHVAATYDGRRMRLYLNGSEVGSTSKSGSLPTNNAPVNIGRSPNGTSHLHGAVDDVRIYDYALSRTEIEALATGSAPAPTPAPPPPPPSSPPPSNQSPSVSLTAPQSGATFTAPATIGLTASASDSDGTIARVDFYAGETLLGSDTSSPYSVTWSAVVPGGYSLRAVARDNAGASTVSGTRDVTVRAPSLPSTAVFVPSSNHAAAVDRYVLDFFRAGADPTVSNPVVSLDIGKPAIVNGECRADITSAIVSLPAGTYIATVTAVGSGGEARSAPSPQFTR